eukprot:gene9144-12333_t
MSKLDEQKNTIRNEFAATAELERLEMLLMGKSPKENHKLNHNNKILNSDPFKVKNSRELYNAINDDNIVSVERVYKYSTSNVTGNLDSADELHQSAIFSNNPINRKNMAEAVDDKISFNNNKANIDEGATSNLPLYKILKSKDHIIAQYSDGNYYPAIIKSVIHGGYLSAAYDIIFDGYSTIENISWKDVKSLVTTTIESDIVSKKHETFSSHSDAYTWSKKHGIPPPPKPPRIHKSIHNLIMQIKKDENVNNFSKELSINNDAVANNQTNINIVENNNSSFLSDSIPSVPIVNATIFARAKGGWKSKK